jgi:hypothetical protein
MRIKNTRSQSKVEVTFQQCDLVKLQELYQKNEIDQTDIIMK